MKLEERYIRTYDGHIRKIKVVSKENAPLVLCVINGKPYTVDDIKRASSNIIDLIEKNDFVNGKRVSCKIDKYIYLEDEIRVSSKQIKSIVTKEQFSQMEYKVGE